MKYICKVIGKVFLGLSSLFIIASPASMEYVGLEELPESIKNKR